MILKGEISNCPIITLTIQTLTLLIHAVFLSPQLVINFIAHSIHFFSFSTSTNLIQSCSILLPNRNNQCLRPPGWWYIRYAICPDLLIYHITHSSICYFILLNPAYTLSRSPRHNMRYVMYCVPEPCDSKKCCSRCGEACRLTLWNPPTRTGRA